MSQGVYTSAAVAGRRTLARGVRADLRAPLGVATLCALALALVWALAEFVPGARVRDGVALHDFTALSRPAVDGVARTLVHALNPLPLALWGAALICIALARRSPRTALAVAGVIGFAQITAEALKPLLSRPRAYVGPDSWPSGHSTAALALAAAVVLVAPRRLQPVAAAAGVAFAAAVGCALLILGLHMPSDVLGGYLVAALWSALVVAALRVAERRRPA
ncbi:MAG: hypothetical protein QOI03_1927 [Solirubrobacteraceae bacterium]|jgi:membrane-associated phospholipid phosphatase|nr:hypothetical protein [Solirubrobacteraceae bacterium]